MSRRKQSGPPTAKGNQGDGVGYGRPPREHQFKPGQSGNKNGRPKGSKNEATIINEILDRKIPSVTTARRGRSPCSKAS
ncbi:DUF5681 domain-containing protein [Bradyrhizobium ottawaense]|uniref:DUF5681 domain-containing protein n=1 Tax=Bradyrhizobium ottawaense TaxID=931866 RepID=UPI003F9F81FE